MSCTNNTERSARLLNRIRRFTWGTPIALSVAIWLSVFFTPDGSIANRALMALFVSVCGSVLVIPVGVILGLLLELVAGKTRTWMGWGLLGIVVVAIIGASFYDSLPSTNFRRLVLDQSSAGYAIQHYRVQSSFNDGCWHFFALSCDKDFVSELVKQKDLRPASGRYPDSIMVHLLKPASLPEDAEFFEGGRLKLAWSSSHRLALVLWSPPPPKPVVPRN